MRRLILLLVLCAATTASADGFYFTESYGASRVHDQLGAYMPGTELHLHAALGMRRGRWSLGFFVAGELDASGNTSDGVSTVSFPDEGPQTFGYGLEAKYLSPVSRHVELYLRGSAGTSSIKGDGLDGYSGRSLGMGAGIQLKGKVPVIGLLWFPLFFTNWGPKMTASIYLDTGYDFYRYHRGNDASIDASVTNISAGFSFGTDF